MKGDVLSYVKELTYFKGLRTLYLVSTIEDNVLMESASVVRKNSIQTLLGVCLLSILISWFFVRFFSKKINKITEAISNYDKGIDNAIELPINRKDEIGALASTFNKMKAKIDSQVSALQTSLEKEKEARNQRDEFLQNMSHEMRTPLNAILGLTKLLHKNAPTEAQLPIINTLERTSNSLAGLVYDVLDHKKISEGRVHIVHEPTNIEEILKDIYATYQYEAIQKGLTFTLHIDEKLKNQSFLTDALRLSQIIINLVVNAIKYTQEGTINLLAKLDDKASVLEIKVIDTGIGILPENIDKINDRFFREKDDLSGRYGSYGLGLSIVKQLTILFGGTLKAKSEKDKGSEFCVKVPVISALKTENKVADKPIIYPKLNKPYKMLHIEDDLSTLELISYIFNDNNIQLIQLNKWYLVNESIRENKPDIIISDLMLENENLSPKLMDWISTKKVTCPIILVSATEPEKMSQLSALYFQKPFNIDYLKDTVIKLLGSQEYSPPDFSNIYSNYDHNSSKIIKVLKLLEEEFETYLKRIDMVIKSKDEHEWEAILHKLIAHINNLKLISLYEVLPQKVKTITNEDLENIHNAFAYYMCCIRVEIQINLKD